MNQTRGTWQTAYVFPLVFPCVHNPFISPLPRPPVSFFVLKDFSLIIHHLQVQLFRLAVLVNTPISSGRQKPSPNEEQCTLVDIYVPLLWQDHVFLFQPTACKRSLSFPLSPKRARTKVFGIFEKPRLRHGQIFAQPLSCTTRPGLPLAILASSPLRKIHH